MEEAVVSEPCPDPCFGPTDAVGLYVPRGRGWNCKHLEWSSAEFCSRVPGLCGGHFSPFHSLSLSLSLMHKAKFNLMRRIMYLINLIFNIQAEVFPSQHIYERCSGRNVNES